MTAVTTARAPEAREAEQGHEFLEYISQGIGPLNAALAVGWSPAKLRLKMSQPDFAELVSEAKEITIEQVEQKLTDMALRGHFGSIQMILYSKGQERGWRPPSQKIDIQQETKVSVEVIESQKVALLEIIREHGIEAVQPEPPKLIEATASDDD